MARPKLSDSSESLRLHMMITEDEIRAVDDWRRKHRIPVMMSDEEMNSVDNWRFESRVATRSEAIRQLIKLGLEAAPRAKASS